MTEYIKLKLVSNGTPEGSYVIDQEDGRHLDGIVSVSWTLDNDGNPSLVLTLVGVPVEINFSPEKIQSVEDVQKFLL
jgi:hypothetical protein